MAQQTDPTSEGFNVVASRYSESLVPQFVGGDIDPATGNLVAPTRLDAMQGRMVTQGRMVKKPAQPTTRLGTIMAGGMAGDSVGTVGLGFGGFAQPAPSPSPEPPPGTIAFSGGQRLQQG